jgi:small-conductance mechanosensitive channel
VSYVEIHGILVPKLAIGMAIVLVYVIASFALRHLFLGYIGRLAEKSETRWDDAIVAALRAPLTLIILASAGWVCIQYLRLPPTWNQTIDQLTRVGFIFAFILFVDRFLRESVAIHQKHLDEMNLTQGFARALIRVAVLILGTLVLLDTLHISITPILASLGVGGLAVGLALQGTLSNMFAGIQLISTQPIRVGDFIKLQTGEEGFVTEIGWRATRIRMLPNNAVFVPNSRLADSVITNYDLPERELAVLVQVGVSYASDLNHVERVTLEVATEIQKTVAGAVPDFLPSLRYHTFDSSSINFTVALRARHFVEQHLMKHEFIKRLHARYNQEGIVFPSPIRTLDVSVEAVKRLSAIAGSPKGS